MVAAAGLVALGLALGPPLAFLAVEEPPVGREALRLSRSVAVGLGVQAGRLA